MNVKAWLVIEWRKMLGQHNKSMNSHEARLDPVDMKIKDLEGRTAKVERILKLYETERNTITLPRRGRPPKDRPR